MLQSKIAPSMMCADLLALKKQLEAFEAAGIEYLHIDIMDGSFVSNFTLGTDYIKNLRRITKIPLDIHMMINRPEEKLGWFDIRAGDLVSVHYESTPHIQAALQKIRAVGARPMVALNPATPISVLQDIAVDLDGVLVMTVNPGFAGQKLVPQTLKKIARLRNWLDRSGYEGVEIEADGNVSLENAFKMRQYGANIFVAGTSSIFTKDKQMESAINDLREAIL